MPINRFAWSLDERFTPHQVGLIEAASHELESYLGGIIPGRAFEWILQHTRGTRIHRGGLFTKIAARINKLPTSLVLPYRDIWLWEDFDRFYLPKRHFLHELGHVVENNLPKKFLSPPTIFGGGASDRLTQFPGRETRRAALYERHLRHPGTLPLAWGGEIWQPCHGGLLRRGLFLAAL